YSRTRAAKAHSDGRQRKKDPLLRVTHVNRIGDEPRLLLVKSSKGLDSYLTCVGDVNGDPFCNALATGIGREQARGDELNVRSSSGGSSIITYHADRCSPGGCTGRHNIIDLKGRNKIELGQAGNAVAIFDFDLNPAEFCRQRISRKISNYYDIGKVGAKSRYS